MLFIEELLWTLWEENGKTYRKKNRIMPLQYEKFAHNLKIILFKHQINLEIQGQ